MPEIPPCRRLAGGGAVRHRSLWKKSPNLLAPSPVTHYDFEKQRINRKRRRIPIAPTGDIAIPIIQQGGGHAGSSFAREERP
ncbi:MAG: hypothetical protein PVH30_00085 [Desulfobacterales bacterium]